MHGENGSRTSKGDGKRLSDENVHRTVTELSEKNLDGYIASKEKEILARALKESNKCTEADRNTSLWQPSMDYKLVLVDSLNTQRVDEDKSTKAVQTLGRRGPTTCFHVRPAVYTTIVAE